MLTFTLHTSDRLTRVRRHPDGVYSIKSVTQQFSMWSKSILSKRFFGVRGVSELDQNSSVRRLILSKIGLRSFNELSALPLANLQLIVGLSTSKVFCRTYLVARIHFAVHLLNLQLFILFLFLCPQLSDSDTPHPSVASPLDDSPAQQWSRHAIFQRRASESRGKSDTAQGAPCSSSPPPSIRLPSS